MDVNKKLVIWKLIYTITVLRVTDSCICKGKIHIQTSICSAEFAIQAIVTGEREIITQNDQQTDSRTTGSIFSNIRQRRPAETWKYPIKILSFFKSSKQFESADQSYVFSKGPPSTCGVNLIKAKRYLFTGKVLNDQLNVDLCDLHPLWSDLTKKQKRFLKKDIYINSCECMINNCVHPMSCPVNPPPMDVPHTDCIYDGPNTGCLKKFSYCQKRKHGCLWKSNNQLVSCQN